MATITLTSEEQTINLVTEGSVSLSASNGKSAYQSYLSTTTDDPVLTEAEWAEGGGGGGGDYLPLAGGIMDNGAEIAFDNDSKIRQTPGSNGIDQVCSIDYVHRWKEGSLYIMDQSGGIRSVQYGLSFTPDSTFDVTGGYLVGSRFIKDDGTVFECTDNTDGAAVWVDVTPLTEVEVTSATATDISGLLKGNGSVVSAATAGTDYVATDDARFHDRSHAMTSTSDHTAGNWKVFHSNGSGQLVELALGADGTFLKSNGASIAPTFATPAGGGSSITGTGFAYVRSGGVDLEGTIGDPSKPYLTAQAAWDDGARNIEFGVGSYTITHVSSESDASLDIFFRGAGKESTTLDFTFTGLNGTAGVDQTDPGQTGNPGTGGGNAGAFTLSSDKSLSINLVAKGGTGGNGGKGGPGSADPEIVGGNGGYGGNAGNGPTYEVFNCVLATLYNETDPGQGGPPGDDGGFGTGIQGASGTSGAGVTQHYYWCDINSFGNNVSPGYMDVCFRDDKLFANVPSNRVEYGAGFVEGALDVLYGERVETRRIESTNWVTTSSTVADVNNLSCLIDQYEQLTIEIFGFHTSGTGGMKVSFSGPSSPTFLRYNFHHWTTVTAVRSPIPGAATAFNTDLTEGAGSAVVMPFHVLLTVKNGANQGTIQFRAASVTGGQTLTLLQETVMRVTR